MPSHTKISVATEPLPALIIREAGWWGVKKGAILGALCGFFYFSLQIVLASILEPNESFPNDLSNVLSSAMVIMTMTGWLAGLCGFFLGALIGGIFGVLGGILFNFLTRIWARSLHARIKLGTFAVYVTAFVIFIFLTFAAMVMLRLDDDILKSNLIIVAILIALAIPFGARHLLKIYETEASGAK